MPSSWFWWLVPFWRSRDWRIPCRILMRIRLNVWQIKSLRSILGWTSSGMPSCSLIWTKFNAITSEEVDEVLQMLNSITYVFNPCLSWLVRVTHKWVQMMENDSLQEWVVLSSLKKMMVSPVLKRGTLFREGCWEEDNQQFPRVLEKQITWTHCSWGSGQDTTVKQHWSYLWSTFGVLRAELGTQSLPSCNFWYHWIWYPLEPTEEVGSW